MKRCYKLPINPCIDTLVHGDVDLLNVDFIQLPDKLSGRPVNSLEEILSSFEITEAFLDVLAELDGLRKHFNIILVKRIFRSKKEQELEFLTMLVKRYKHLSFVITNGYSMTKINSQYIITDIKEFYTYMEYVLAHVNKKGRIYAALNMNNYAQDIKVVEALKVLNLTIEIMSLETIIHKFGEMISVVFMSYDAAQYLQLLNAHMHTLIEAHNLSIDLFTSDTLIAIDKRVNPRFDIYEDGYTLEFELCNVRVHDISIIQEKSKLIILVEDSQCFTLGATIQDAKQHNYTVIEKRVDGLTLLETHHTEIIKKLLECGQI